MTKAEDKARKGMVRLLQFLLPGPATRLDLAGDGEALGSIGAKSLSGADRLVHLRSARGQSQAFPAPLLAVCARHGLIRLERNTCHTLPPARALLKRLITGADLGFAAQHGLIEQAERLVEGEVRLVTVNSTDNALSALSRLKERDGTPWFPSLALRAGDRLLADFTFGGLQPRVTAPWEPRLGGGKRAGPGAAADLSDHATDARARVAKAMRALGPDLSGVALDVCCFSKGLELVERERQWPARSAKLMLRTALMTLARHYGLPGA